MRQLHRHAQDQCRRLGVAAQCRAHHALCGEGARLFRQALHRRQHHPVRRRPVGDSAAAVAQGTAIVSVSDVAIGRGLKVQADLGPRAAHAAGLRGAAPTSRPSPISRASGSPRPAAASAASTGAWAARCCKSAKLDGRRRAIHLLGTAGRLPGLVAGQIDGVALHPEDVFLAQKQKPALHLLVQLVDLMPLYMFNAYGASTEWIAKDRALLRDTVAAMIEANRTIYRDKDKVVPIMVRGDAEAAGSGRIRLGDRDQELHLVGQRRLRSRSAPSGRSTTTSPTATSRPPRSRPSSRSST